MKRSILALPLIFGFLLTACASGAAAGAGEPSVTGTLPALPTESGPHIADTANAPADLARTDQQGMVTFEVTPLNLTDASDTLDFSVAMNTHSVDLSMNLATLATLSTDTGVSVQAISWDGPAGGHHVSGKLSFPAQKDGKSILDGATKLTLTIVNVDAPSRVFEWQLQ